MALASYASPSDHSQLQLAASTSGAPYQFGSNSRSNRSTLHPEVAHGILESIGERKSNEQAKLLHRRRSKRKRRLAGKLQVSNLLDEESARRREESLYFYHLKQQQAEQQQLNQHPQRPAIFANQYLPRHLMGMAHSKNLKPVHVPVNQQTVNGLLALLLLFIISICGSIGTIFIMSALTVIESLQTRGNCYLVSLAMSHLLVTLFVIPSSALQIMAGEQGLNSQTLCHYQWLMLEFSLMVGHLSFALIAVDNYLGYSCSEKVVTKLAAANSSERAPARRANSALNFRPPPSGAKLGAAERDRWTGKGDTGPFSHANAGNVMKPDTPTEQRQLLDKSQAQILQEEFFRTKAKSKEENGQLTNEPAKSVRGASWLCPQQLAGKQRPTITKPKLKQERQSRGLATRAAATLTDSALFNRFAGRLMALLQINACRRKEGEANSIISSKTQGEDGGKGARIGWRLAEQFAGDHSGAQLKRPGCFSYRSCCGRARVLLWIFLTWFLSFLYVAHEHNLRFGPNFCASPLQQQQPQVGPSGDLQRPIGFLLGNELAALDTDSSASGLGQARAQSPPVALEAAGRGRGTNQTGVGGQNWRLSGGAQRERRSPVASISKHQLIGQQQLPPTWRGAGSPALDKTAQGLGSNFWPADQQLDIGAEPPVQWGNSIAPEIVAGGGLGAEAALRLTHSLSGEHLTNPANMAPAKLVEQADTLERHSTTSGPGAFRDSGASAVAADPKPAATREPSEAEVAPNSRQAGRRRLIEVRGGGVAVGASGRERMGPQTRGMTFMRLVVDEDEIGQQMSGAAAESHLGVEVAVGATIAQVPLDAKGGRPALNGSGGNTFAGFQRNETRNQEDKRRRQRARDEAPEKPHRRQPVTGEDRERPLRARAKLGLLFAISNVGGNRQSAGDAHRVGRILTRANEHGQASPLELAASGGGGGGRRNIKPDHDSRAPLPLEASHPLDNNNDENEGPKVERRHDSCHRNKCSGRRRPTAEAMELGDDFALARGQTDRNKFATTTLTATATRASTMAPPAPSSTISGRAELNEEHWAQVRSSEAPQTGQEQPDWAEKQTSATRGGHSRRPQSRQAAENQVANNLAPTQWKTNDGNKRPLRRLFDPAQTAGRILQGTGESFADDEPQSISGEQLAEGPQSREHLMNNNHKLSSQLEGAGERGGASSFAPTAGGSGGSLASVRTPARMQIMQASNLIPVALGAKLRARRGGRQAEQRLEEAEVERAPNVRPAAPGHQEAAGNQLAIGVRRTRDHYSSSGGNQAAEQLATKQEPSTKTAAPPTLAPARATSDGRTVQLEGERALFWLVLLSTIVFPSLASAFLFARAYFRMKEFKMRPYKPVPVATLATTPPALLTPRSPIPLIAQRQVYTFDAPPGSPPLATRGGSVADYYNELEVQRELDEGVEKSDCRDDYEGQKQSASEEDEDDPGALLARAANEMARRVSAQSGGCSGSTRSSMRRNGGGRQDESHAQLNQAMSAPPIATGGQRATAGRYARRDFRTATLSPINSRPSHLMSPVLQRTPPIAALYCQQAFAELSMPPNELGATSYSAPPTACFAIGQPQLANHLAPHEQQPPDTGDPVRHSDGFSEYKPAVSAQHWGEQWTATGGANRCRQQRHSSPTFAYASQMASFVASNRGAASASRQRGKHHAQSFHYGQGSPRSNAVSALHRRQSSNQRLSMPGDHDQRQCEAEQPSHEATRLPHFHDKQQCPLGSHCSLSRRARLPWTDVSGHRRSNLVQSNEATQFRCDDSEQLALTQKPTPRDQSSKSKASQADTVSIALANVIKSATDTADWQSSASEQQHQPRQQLTSNVQQQDKCPPKQQRTAGLRGNLGRPASLTRVTSETQRQAGVENPGEPVEPLTREPETGGGEPEGDREAQGVRYARAASFVPGGENKVILYTYSYMTDDQLLKSNILVFVVNFFLWLPFVILTIMLQFANSVEQQQPQDQIREQSAILTPEFKDLVWWLATLNCCSCSYLYALTNKDFREAFNKLFYYCCCKSHVTFQKKTPIFRRQLDMDSKGPPETTAPTTTTLVITDHNHHHHHQSSLASPFNH